MKRAIIFLAALALALTTAGTAGGTVMTESEFDYLAQEDGAAVINRYLGSAAELTVPDRLGGHLVKRIEAYAFSNNRELKAVTLPQGLEAIGVRAFVGCMELERLRIPAGVTSIGDSAFLTTGLAEITVDAANPVYSAVDGVLFHLPTATLHTYPQAKAGVEYSVPSGILGIENGAFQYCASLKKIVLPNSLTNIGESAFCGCAALASLSVPASVLNIGTKAFQGTALDTISVSGGNPAYEQREGVLFDRANKALHTFPARKSVPEYRIPTDVKAIMPYAFAECAGLEHVIYPEGVKTTFYSAFYYTSGLKRVTLPESVEKIDVYSFYYCKNLKNINIPSRVSSIEYCAFAGCESLDGVIIPGSVTSIGGSAFSRCLSLKRLDIPDGVISIGNLAFEYCPKLTLTVGAGSFAESYARNNGIPYKLR